MSEDNKEQFKAETVDQIGILIDSDPEEASKVWEEMFGIGPWRIQELNGTDEKGEPVKHFKIAFAELNGVEIELAQPFNNKSYHKKYVDTHPEGGLHHICFRVDDIDEALAGFVSKGAKVLAHNPGRMAYFTNGGPDGVIFELLRKKKKK